MGSLHSQHLLHYYQDTAPSVFCIVISYVRSYFPLFVFKSALLVFCIVISSAGAYFTLDRRKNPLCVVRELVLCTEPRYYATRSFPTSTIFLHGSMIFAEFAAFQPIISGTKPTLDPFQIFEQMSKLKYIKCTLYRSIVVLCNILENFVHTIIHI